MSCQYDYDLAQQVYILLTIFTTDYNSLIDLKVLPKNSISYDGYIKQEEKESSLLPPYKDLCPIFPSQMVVDTFPMTVVSGQQKPINVQCTTTTSKNHLRRRVSFLCAPLHILWGLYPITLCKMGISNIILWVFSINNRLKSVFMFSFDCIDGYGG